MEQHSLKVPKKSKYNGADNQQTQGNKGIPKINTKTNEITSDEPVYTAKRSNASLSSRQDKKKKKKPLMPSLHSVSILMAFLIQKQIRNPTGPPL